MEIRQTTAQKLKLMGRMKLAQFLSLSENEFKEYIDKIEENPLFNELRYKYHLIGYKRFHDVIEKPSSLRFKEELISQEGNFNVEELMENPEILPLLKKVGSIIGIEEFNKLLHGKDGQIRKIIEKCDLSNQEAKIFKDFINKFQLQKILTTSSSDFSFPSYPKVFLIASIEKEDGRLIIHPLKKESYLIKGKFSINYHRFEELIGEKKLTPSQINKISALFKKLELINRRTTTIYQVIYHLKEIQQAFFNSGNPEDLFPLSQSELARRIGVHPSSIGRVITNKSILTPQGEEKLLKFFFSKRRVQNFIKKILIEEKKRMEMGILSKPFNDRFIQKKLEDKYKIKVARRTVSEYRKLMGISSSYHRHKKSNK